MSEANNPDPSSNQQIIDKLNALESRIKSIESHLRYISPRFGYEREEEEEYSEIRIKKPTDSAIESNLVEYGLTWLSTIVFIFGIIFLMAYIRSIE